MDDLHLPQNELTPVECLASYMEHRGWYDQATRGFYQVEKTTFIGAYTYQNIPGLDIFDENVTNLPGSLLQRSQLMSVDGPGEGDLVRIFGSVIVDPRARSVFSGYLEAKE